jgi:hypothetical protein
VTGFGFVAAAGICELIEGAAAEDAHPGLAVSHRGFGYEGKNGACKAVHRAPVRRHGFEVVEAVADDQLGFRGRLEQGRDRAGRVLTVGVDDEHRLRGGLLGEELGEPGADRVALAAAAWES